MPVMCRLIGGKWRLVDKDGTIKSGAKHDDAASCKKQAAAMNANMEFSDGGTIYQDLDTDDWECSDGLTYEKQLIYAGKFRKGEQAFSVEEADIDHWVDTFSAWKENDIEVPGPLEHTRNPEQRRATVDEIYKKEDSRGRVGLFSKIRFRDEDAAKLAKTADVSLYSPKTYEAAGKQWERPIVHVALTDYPVIKGLDKFDIVASLTPPEEETDMSLEKLIGALELSLDDGQDAEELILSHVKSLAEKVTTLEDSVKKKDSEIKTLKLSQKTEPVKHSSAIRKVLADNRDLKLSALVDGGKITPAVKKGLMDVFTTDSGLDLVLSDSPDNFEEIVGLLAQNEPVKLRSTETGVQVLKLSADQMGSDEDNPLLKDLKKRRQAAGLEG